MGSHRNPYDKRKKGRNCGIPLVLALFFVSVGLAAQESHELTLATLYYQADDYAKAYTHFQNLILRHSEFSGDTLYRYAYSHERLRGLDATAMRIYALAWYRFHHEGQSDSPYARYTADKLKNGSPFGEAVDEAEAAALLEELRAGIDAERKAQFHRHVDRIYGFLSRFSLFQWKIIASLAMTLPLFIGIVVLRTKKSSRS